MKTAGLVALAMLAVAAMPALAGGPIDASGEVHPDVDAWLYATAGSNPMTANEAAAALAFFGGCLRHDYITRDELDMNSFARDVVSGGNVLGDFDDGGKHRGLFWLYMRSWEPQVNTGDTWSLSVLCSWNPYLEFE